MNAALTRLEAALAQSRGGTPENDRALCLAIEKLPDEELAKSPEQQDEALIDEAVRMLLSWHGTEADAMEEAPGALFARVRFQKKRRPGVPRHLHAAFARRRRALSLRL